MYLTVYEFLKILEEERDKMVEKEGLLLKRQFTEDIRARLLSIGQTVVLPLS